MMIPRETLERDIIASVLFAPEVFKSVRLILGPEDFSGPDYRAVFVGMDALEAEKPDSIDFKLLVERFGETFDYSKIAEEQKDAFSGQFVCNWSRKLKEYSDRDRLKQIAEQLAREANDAALSRSEIINQTIDHLSALIPDQDGFINSRELAEKFINNLEERARSGMLRGNPTGFRDLDKLLAHGGLAKGQPTVIGGHTSHGKSSLVTSIEENMLAIGIRFLHVTFEDSAESTFARMVSATSGVAAERIFKGMQPEDWNPTNLAVNRLAALQFDMLEDNFDIDNVCLKVKARVRRDKIEHVTFDFLQLIQSNQRFTNQQQKIDHIYSRIVTLIRSMPDTSAIVVSQLSREQEDGVRPTLAKLYHSGSIEQWANTVLLLWVPEEAIDLGLKIVSVQKQKDGATGDVVLAWKPEIMQFTDADEDNKAILWNRLSHKKRNTRKGP